jgi:3-hydroxybutyrate dehydrogenase
LNGLGDAHAIDGLRAELAGNHGVDVTFDPADLAAPDQIEAMLGRALARFGGVDILVNNAVTRHYASVEHFPVQKWDHALAVNLSAAFHTTRLALPA